ncbi:MAG: HlyC/CorC family transporter [Lachnospiraceae bacterium]|nr:HlyC/CorC family transporter [Lachnospiraceae bacterium]
MDSGEVIQLLFVVVLLMLSAFFSSAETALTTSNKIRLKGLADEGDKRAKRVLEITGDSGKMLSAILIGNNIVNLSASSIATALAIKLFGNAGAGIATGALTVLVLIFGEISPKTLATIHADKIALSYGGIIWGLMKVLTPVIFIINKLAIGFLRLLRVNVSNEPVPLTEAELRTIVDVGHQTGVIEQEEHEMINNVFDFGDSQAKEIMVPRIDMTFADINSTYEELINIFRTDKFTRLPIYEDSIDNVIGIINMKDLLLYETSKDSFSVRSILRKPYYTYEHKKTVELLIEMKKSSFNIAIVLDEYGVTAGLITLEDILEEIVGEIRDEYDMDEEDPIQKLNDREYIIQGSMNLEDLCDVLNLQLSSKDYDTVGGYMIELLDHLPNTGEETRTPENVLLRVEAMDKNRISKLYLCLPEEEAEEK